MIRVALYERVSTDAQAEKYGLHAQHWALERRIQERGYRHVPDAAKDAYVDDGYSGGDLNRPALTRLREGVRQGLVDVVLCYDPDRLSRSLTDLLLLSDECARAKVRLEFITQETDASPEGRLFFSLRGAVAEYERAKIRERTSRGRIQKARQGKVVSGNAAPYGYRYDKQSSTLVIHEEEAKHVRLAFQLYLEDRLSLYQLAERMSRLRIPSARGGTHWYPSMVGRMLRHEAYVGNLWQNRTRTVNLPPRAVGGVKRRHYPNKLPEDWIVAAVPPIVGQDVFDTVQKRLAENSVFSKRNTKREYLLSGLIKHSCGYAMSGRMSHKIMYYYCLHCNRPVAFLDEADKPVKQRTPWVRGNELEAVVWDTVASLLQNPELLEQQVKELAGGRSATAQAIADELTACQKHLAALPRQEERIVEGFAKGMLSQELLGRQLARIRQEREEMEAKQAELLRQQELQAQASRYLESANLLAERLRVGLDRVNFEQRREILRLLVNRITYHDGGNVHIDAVLQLHPTYVIAC